MVQRYALKIAYIGKNYQGFQRQKENIKTIEGTIFSALIELGIITSDEKTRYSAAGRTDAGVSAVGQVIAFDSQKDTIYLEEINQKLPDDIYAIGIAKVPEDFNARRNAIKRSYRYFAPYNGENIRLMKQGMKKLLGTHNFEKFCKKPDKLPSGVEKSTILTLDKATLRLMKKNRLLIFDFSSRSFLWKQVRKMVSAILAIGKKKYSPQIIDLAFDMESNEPIGGIKPVPAEGLILYNVEYKNVKFEPMNKKELVLIRIQSKFDLVSSEHAVIQMMQKKLL
ncbi:MAG: tRNA pseudouridine(38-40) synthase TruA [Candidatus Thorarchaeota archaeon]